MFIYFSYFSDQVDADLPAERVAEDVTAAAQTVISGDITRLSGENVW